MAAVLHYARLIPLALRVTLAGGATYGTVKAGAWSDAKESRERLDQFQQSLPMREVEYPPLPETAGEQGKSLAVKSGELSSLKTTVVHTWNSGVRSLCRSLTGDRPLFHSEGLSKSWNKAPPPEKKRKETLLSAELGKFLEKKVRVKFQGGREATGILKGYDQLLNLVLDGTVEHIQDPEDPFKLTDQTRALGLVVCRGTAVVLICPADSMEAIENPFIQQQTI